MQQHLSAVSFAEKTLQEVSAPDIEAGVEEERKSPKMKKHDESQDEEEDASQKPVPQTPKRKKQLDTCEL